MLKKQEIGRSMVEMLGVLAIIGLISIGGLYGYTTAMKKHQANELINEAQKRAVIAAMNIASGKEVPDDPEDISFISEFTDPLTHSFGIFKKNREQFNIRVTDVPKEVCEEIRKAIGSVVRNVSECNDSGTVDLTFNNDMSLTAKAGDNDGNESACQMAGNQYCSDTAKCITLGGNMPQNLSCTIGSAPYIYTLQNRS